MCQQCRLVYSDRFLREWDCSNHDPAKAAISLANFAKTLRVLFVDGYIMFDSAQEVAGLGPAKTITQIAMEQCQDMIVIRYGTRTKCLWSKTSPSECAAVLAEISSVVGDVLARLDADFHTQDLYMCFEALDLDTWRSVLAATQHERGIRSIPLQKKAQRLFDAVGATWDVYKFARLVKNVVEFRGRLLRQDSKRDVDNRKVWAHWLATSPEHAGWALPVVQFYVSHPDGTGDVERGLGEHARFRDCHRGAHEGQDRSATEMCLEIRKEGPQEECGLFTQGANGHLLLTDFSRQLAEIWLERHGRRFSCLQTQRRDEGRTGTGWRLRGSFKAVSLCQKEATKALVAQAARDGGRAAAAKRPTIIGTSHGRLMDHVLQESGPTASKKLLSFRGTTAGRMEEKNKFGNWAGYTPKPPALRRKPGAIHGHLGEAASASSAAHTAARSAHKWMVRRNAPAATRSESSTKRKCPVLVVCDKSSDSGTQPYKKVRTEVCASAGAVVVGSQGDLLTRKPDNNLLVTWTNIIGLGKKVHARDDPKKSVSFATAAPANIDFGSEFIKKHPKVVKAYRHIAKMPKSHWREDATGQKITAAEDFRKLLVSLQRFGNIAGLQCKFGAGKKTEVTRFGTLRPRAATPGGWQLRA